MIGFWARTSLIETYQLFQWHDYEPAELSACIAKWMITINTIYIFTFSSVLSSIRYLSFTKKVVREEFVFFEAIAIISILKIVKIFAKSIYDSKLNKKDNF